MNIACHPAQGSHALALASCGYDNRLFIRIIFKLFYINQRIFRYVDTVQVLGNLNDVYHTPAFNHYLTSKPVRRVDNLLNAVHIGSKGCNNDSRIFMFRKNRIKNFSQRLFGLGKACPLCICTVAHQRKHAFFADLCESLQVNGISVNRRIIHLKVAGMDNGARRGINCERSCIHDTVVRFDIFNSELSKVNRLTELYNLALGSLYKIMLLQLIFYNTHRQFCGIDGNV